MVLQIKNENYQCFRVIPIFLSLKKFQIKIKTMYQIKVDIVSFPSTKKFSKIGKFIDTNKFHFNEETDIPRGIPHDLFFFINTTPKVNDWCIVWINMTMTACKINDISNLIEVIDLNGEHHFINFWNVEGVIIGCTNPDLCLQNPPDKLLKDYCNKGGYDSLFITVDEYMFKTP